MSCVSFFDENFVDPDIISNSYYSSQQTSFPASNAYNKQRRSKVWRSNGYWEITSSNNVIIFREAVGVDLIATITAGEYTSTTTFLAAIDTALEAAGVANYTSTVDSLTGKIIITSDLSGGATVFQLRCTDVLMSGFCGIAGFDTASNRTGASSYTADVLKIATSEWLKWDFGVSSNPTAFALIGARNASIKIGPGSTLTLQGNETDNWSSPSYSTTVTYDDEAIVMVDDDGFHTEALRYWRFLISDTSNANGYVEIGSIFLGEFYNPTTGSPQFPLQSKYIDRSNTVFSEGGQTFSDIREKSQSFTLSWFALTKDELEEFERIFNTFGTSVPFFLYFDPNAVFTTTDNHSLRFVKFMDEPSYELVAPNIYRWQASFREEL